MSVERHRFVPSRNVSLWMGLNPGRLFRVQMIPLVRQCLASGTLFDDDYKVCPHWTRLLSGEIADLTLSRDVDEEDEVHAAGMVANPGNRCLGANACQAALVAILGDGDPVAGTMPPGTWKAAFGEVKTGTE